MDDLTARPLLDSVVISATGEIERHRERFSARSLVAWQVGALGDKVEIGVFADDMRSAFHIRRADIQFTKFHPEVFFITCSNQSDRDAILRQPRLTAPSGRVYLFRPWDESLHGIPARYRYRARLCIEGVPMHRRTDEAAAKVIGRKCAIHYVEEYSRRGNYNRTYDMWVWTGEPRAIPRGGTFAITDADEEGLPTDIPLPELDPLRNPLPSEPKKGWTYNVLVHVDTLEDLHTRKARAYKWDYEVQDDGIRFKEYPLPCRAEPDLARGPTMTMMIERTTPKAVIEAVHSGTGSVAALPVGIGREDVLEILESHLDPMLHEAAVNHSMYSPDTNSPRVSFPVFVTSFARPASAPTLTPLAAAKDSQITEFINDIATSIQPPLLPAPDVNVRKPSRVKVKIPVIASAQRHSERLLYKRRANAKFENFTQEILSKKFGIMNDSASFDDNVKKLYLQRYKKPLSPASLKTIADLVEKGGCKAIRLKASKKASVAPLWLTLAD
ncbi:hypothetical protein OsJ_21879 [Oryza sativa Japonica Group]|uniref:Uncharacterized protein n=1 Tax=Oryza sativa subsp. japonica TaxID=39947 RepID=B9FU07_ORYSJ|nr:hypothetical protein OsJ_21879 [Oryza sativa Japonica Group]